MANYIYTNGRLYNADYLSHHGVKGMRWGVRRYQNADGTLTAEGKRKYDKASKKQSTHRTNLEAKYRNMGMNQQQARLQADRNIKIKKIVAAAAGITVAAATAYFVTKAVKNRTDLIIKAGTKIQRIGLDENPNLDRAFYAAFKKGDKLKYAGYYGGNELRNKYWMLGAKEPKIFKTTIDALDDVKIASRDKSAKAFVEMYKNDKQFRYNLDAADIADYLNKGEKNKFKNMSDRQLKNKGYDYFNRLMGYHDGGSLQDATDKFHSVMKSKGYDGILDINDMKYSGYNSKKPVILFEKGNKMKVSDVSRLTDDVLDPLQKKATVRIVGEQLAKANIDPAKTPGNYIFGGVGAAAAVNSKTNQTQVRSLHASGLTNEQIAKRLGISASKVSEILNKK